MSGTASASRSGQTGRPADLPIRVRRARPADTRAVLDFTRATWDGWDYLPSVWQAWLEAPDGVLLVALPDAPHQLDLFGRPLSPDRPIGVARVAMLSEREAWLEGLRVDPGVRTRGVARLLHGAALAWARAQGARWVRYATGEDNEGSHRLGAHHGFRLLRPWRSYQPPSEDDSDDADGIVEDGEQTIYDVAADDDQFADLADEPAGEVPEDVEARATGIELPETELAGHGRIAGEGAEPPLPEAARPGAPAATPADARRRLHRAGLALDPHSPPAVADAWWERLAADGTFRAGDRLCEARSWAFQELTRERFEAYVRAGEVLVSGEAPPAMPGSGAASPGASRAGTAGAGNPHERGGSWGLLVLPLQGTRPDGDRPWAAVAAGDADAVLRLAAAARDALGRPVRLRIPDGSPIVVERADAFTAAGFPPSSGTLHVLARELTADAPIDLGPAGLLTLEEPPRRVAVPAEERR